MLTGDAWSVYRVSSGRWYAHSPVTGTSVTAAGPFPSWREAYDYAHTHPSNRKETK